MRDGEDFEPPHSNVSHLHDAHNPHFEVIEPDVSPELSDDILAFNLISHWGQFRQDQALSAIILSDVDASQRLQAMVGDTRLAELGASLHYTGEQFAISMKGYHLSDEQLVALELLYRVHFVYVRTHQGLAVTRHPMVDDMAQQIIAENGGCQEAG